MQEEFKIQPLLTRFQLDKYMFEKPETHNHHSPYCLALHSSKNLSVTISMRVFAACIVLMNAQTNFSIHGSYMDTKIHTKGISN